MKHAQQPQRGRRTEATGACAPFSGGASAAHREILMDVGRVSGASSALMVSFPPPPNIHIFPFGARRGLTSAAAGCDILMFVVRAKWCVRRHRDELLRGNISSPSSADGEEDGRKKGDAFVHRHFSPVIT